MTFLFLNIRARMTQTDRTIEENSEGGWVQKPMARGGKSKLTKQLQVGVVPPHVDVYAAAVGDSCIHQLTAAYCISAAISMSVGVTQLRGNSFVFRLSSCSATVASSR